MKEDSVEEGKMYILIWWFAWEAHYYLLSFLKSLIWWCYECRWQIKYEEDTGSLVQKYIEEVYFSEAVFIAENCTVRPFPSPGINRMCAQSWGKQNISPVFRAERAQWRWWNWICCENQHQPPPAQRRMQISWKPLLACSGTLVMNHELFVYCNNENTGMEHHAGYVYNQLPML